MEIKQCIRSRVHKVIRMLKEFSEDLNCIKKVQSEMKDTLTEIKNNLWGNNSKVDESENQIDYLEYKEANNQSGQQEKKESQKNEDSISSLWDNFKRSNSRIIGVPEGEKSKKLK